MLGVTCKLFFIRKEAHDRGEKIKGRAGRRKKKGTSSDIKKRPDLDRFIDEQKRNFVSYAQGARMYSMNYYSFVKLAKELLVKMYRR